MISEDGFESRGRCELCGPCHRNLHTSIGNAELERGYDSVEALRDHPWVRRFTEWVKDKPHGRV